MALKLAFHFHYEQSAKVVDCRIAANFVNFLFHLGVELNTNDLIGIEQITRAKLNRILFESGESLREEVSCIQQPKLLEGQEHFIAVLNWEEMVHFRSGSYLEDSTSLAFYKDASERLGADCQIINPHSLEVECVDDLILALRTSYIQCPSIIVVLHPTIPVSDCLAAIERKSPVPVPIMSDRNGCVESPVQALLALHLLQTRGKHSKLDKLRILLVGDLLFQPVAKSLLFALEKVGAEVHINAPRWAAPDRIFSRFDVSVYRELPSRELLEKVCPDAIVSIPLSPVTKSLHGNSVKDSMTSYSMYRWLGDLKSMGTTVVSFSERFGEADLFGQVGQGIEDFDRQIQFPSRLDQTVVRMAALRYCIADFP